KSGDLVNGTAMLGTALERLRDIQFGVYYGVFLSEFADALGRVGRVKDGLAAIDEALTRAERNDERWYLAESLRIKGEILLRQPGPDGQREAEVYFHDSLDWARRQQTPAWELRTSMSLGTLRRSQNRLDDARNLVGAGYARFEEGFETADLRAAAQLLKEL